MRANPEVDGGARRDELYREASASYGAALERLARAYELHEEARRDLVQEIHVALWSSFAHFDGRCSLRTWVYRVAHNAATSRTIRSKQRRSRPWASLSELEELPASDDTETAFAERRAFERLLALIQDLNPADRQLMWLYLEGLDASSIGEVTGHSAANVATKIHRIKQLLARHFEPTTAARSGL